MADTNPVTNAPFLPPSPNKRSFLHSRTPSQSPVRHPYHHARQYDPLLRDLSPTATLRAFSGGDEEISTYHIRQSLANASDAEKGLGAKAAQACVELRQWAREIEG